MSPYLFFVDTEKLEDYCGSPSTVAADLLGSLPSLCIFVVSLSNLMCSRDLHSLLWTCDSQIWVSRPGVLCMGAADLNIQLSVGYPTVASNPNVPFSWKYIYF